MFTTFINTHNALLTDFIWKYLPETIDIMADKILTKSISFRMDPHQTVRVGTDCSTPGRSALNL